MLLEPTDAEVIASSRADPERFGAIFDRHAVAVHGFLARRGGQELADDLLGEVFTVAFDARRRYDMTYPAATPWLYGIAANVLRARYRRDGVRARLLRRVPVEPVEDPWAEVDGRLDADRPGARAARAMERWPAGERDVVQLVAWEGLTLVEVAAALRIPQGTARSRLHRARTALRAAVGSPTGVPRHPHQAGETP